LNGLNKPVNNPWYVWHPCRRSSAHRGKTLKQEQTSTSYAFIYTLWLTYK